MSLDFDKSAARRQLLSSTSAHLNANPRHPQSAAACLIAALLFVLGCQAGSPPPSNQEQSPSTSSPAGPTPLNGAALLSSLASAMPEDTRVVAMLSLDGLQSWANAKFVAPFLGDHFDENKQQALFDELSSTLVERIGLDPLSADWAVLALGQTPTVLFLGGELKLAEGLPAKQREGVEVFSLKWEQPVFAVKLTEGPAAMAVFFDDQALNQFLATKNGPSFKDNPRLQSILPLLDELGEAPIMVAISGEGITQGLPPKLQALEAAALSLSNTLEVCVDGSPESISTLQDYFEQARDSLLAEVKKSYENRNDIPTLEALGVVLGQHLSSPFFERLSPTFSERRAKLSIDLDDSMTTVWLFGALSAVAVPAFLRYIELAKSSEAQSNLLRIAKGASLYHSQEHPSPDGLSLQTELFPVMPKALCTAGGSGTKTQPEATDWQAWRALDFQLDSEHRYRYCYQSPDGKSFRAWAEASLTGSGKIDSFFEIRGSSRNGAVELTEIQQRR
ncbi:MAG: hypothetical protein RBU37_02705 [Myxococcota bacterium]|jgi:hypothetical protein|nr:hypothetical protein [Myxococcota bacterium]